MADGVECKDCHEQLSNEYAGPEPRKPCPKCGSTARIISISGSGGITLRGVARMSAQGTVTPPLPSFVLQAVVERGAAVPDGNLIIAVAPAWSKIIALLERDPDAAFKIDPRKWEEIIAGAYSEAGFDEVILTPHSGDRGRDVIAVKKGYWSVRIIDQVKRYAPDNLVKAEEVRALIGVLQMDNQASKRIVTTTSNFAPMIASDPFIAPLIPNRLELVNGTELITRLTDIATGHRV